MSKHANPKKARKDYDDYDTEPICEKVAFRSQVHAERTMDGCRQMVEHTGIGYHPIRAYECPRCASWHLTSTPDHRLMPNQRGSR